MSYIVVYRSLKTQKVYGVVTDNANGLREFSTAKEAEEYMSAFAPVPNGTLYQIVSVYFLSAPCTENGS